MTLERYEGLDMYLGKMFDGETIEEFFADKSNWARVARLMQLGPVAPEELNADRRGGDVLIVSALDFSTSSALCRWKYRGKHIVTLGDLTKHSRKRIGAIPGIDKKALERIEAALDARRLSFALDR